MFSIWVRCSRLLAHAHGLPGSGAQAGRAPTAARLSGWSSAVVVVVGSPLGACPRACCGFTQGMCVSGRSKTTLVLQSGRRCTASTERERETKRRLLTCCPPLLLIYYIPLRALPAFLELSVDRAAKNSPRQALPPALPCPNTEVARPDIDSMSATCGCLHSAVCTINKSMTHR